MAQKDSGSEGSESTPRSGATGGKILNEQKNANGHSVTVCDMTRLSFHIQL